MIPRIAKRGHSFKGAALYYLHDKEAQTDERVEWTYTHNLPTNDPEKAFGWMTYTMMNADRLKSEAGVSSVGRKRKAGSVYSYSLAWHPEERPEQDTMQSAALEMLENLGLIEHEAVIVAHNDTEHSHIHVVCNLVHPEHGKTAVPSYDRLTASTWAENLEHENGKIYCEQRVINNEKRRNEAKQDRQLALVKHREKKVHHAQVIQELYKQSDSGRAFQNAVQEIGYTLASGDRRGFVLVDEQGKIHSLSRQLKGQRAKDIHARLQDVQDLPLGKDIEAERKEALKQQELEQSHARSREQEQRKAIPEVKHDFNTSSEKQSNSTTQHYQPEIEADILIKAEQVNLERKATQKPDTNYLINLDKLREWEQWADRKRHSSEQEQNKFYNRQNVLDEIEALEIKLQKTNNWWSKLNGSHQNTLDELQAKNLTLEDIDMRIEEQNQQLDVEIEQANPMSHTLHEELDYTHAPKVTSDQELHYEQQLKQEAETLKAKMQENERNRMQGRHLGM